MACSFATMAAGASRYLTREGAKTASAARSRTMVIAGPKRLREDLFELAECEILTISAMANQRARHPGSDDPVRWAAPLAMIAAPSRVDAGRPGQANGCLRVPMGSRAKMPGTV